MFLKWDFFCKHAHRKKTKKNIGTNVKKWDWYYSKVSRHAKNKKLFTFRSHESIVAQVVNGVIGEKAQKVVQFVTMVFLLQQGHPMLEYKALKLLKGEIVALDYYCPLKGKIKGQGQHLINPQENYPH